jgi:hypothetical protein
MKMFVPPYPWNVALLLLIGCLIAQIAMRLPI